MAEVGFQVDDRVDITDVNCPVTFVKTKVALEELDEGQILQVHLNDGEPVQNVPRSLQRFVYDPGFVRSFTIYRHSVCD